jgi:hypothetical protein
LNNDRNGNVLKTNIVDRDGGTRAVRASTSASGQQNLFFGVPTFTPSAGDIIACGAWVRSLAGYDYSTMSGAGYSGSSVEPLSCGLHGVSYTTWWTSRHDALNAGDNEWEWVSLAYKIGNLKGSPDYIPFGVYFDAKHPIEVYSPVFVRVPAGTLSDGEAANLLANLRGYSNSCLPGQVCDVDGPLAHLNDSNVWPVAQHFSSITLGSPVAANNQGAQRDGSITYKSELTEGECFSSASPADCKSHIVGFVSIPAGSASVVVNTTAVTADSLISLTFDSTQAMHLHLACSLAAQEPFVSARVPGHSFTISVRSTFSTNPGCVGFRLIN